MYTAFIFKNDYNGSKETYICKTSTQLYKMLKKYDVENIGENTYKINGIRDKKPESYNEIKNIIRGFAIEWSLNFCEYNYSYGELFYYQDFFETYGKRYGLLTEFKENAIC